jgi:hypothetical protein
MKLKNIFVGFLKTLLLITLFCGSLIHAANYMFLILQNYQYTYSHLITPPLLLAVFHLAQNVVVHYYKPITTEWLNFVQTQLNQINEDPST